jgi:hypothetical protein
VRLPAGGSHDRRDGGAARSAQAVPAPACFEFARLVCSPLGPAFDLTLNEACVLAVRPRLRFDMQHSSQSCRRNIAPPPPKPRGGTRAWRGRGVGLVRLAVRGHTHALFALKVQRKVSNGVAGLTAAGSSLDRAENRGNSCHISDWPMPSQASLLRSWH